MDRTKRIILIVVLLAGVVAAGIIFMRVRNHQASPAPQEVAAAAATNAAATAETPSRAGGGTSSAAESSKPGDAAASAQSAQQAADKTEIAVAPLAEPVMAGGAAVPADDAPASAAETAKTDVAAAPKDSRSPAEIAAAEAATRMADTRKRARTLFDQGLTAQRAGDLTGAINAYRQSLEIDAELAGAWTNLALALDATGQTADGLAAARHALTLPAMKDPRRRGNAFYTVGHLALKSGATEEARTSFQEALQADARQASAAVALANLYVEAQAPEKAIAALMVAHEAGAASAAVETNLAVLSLRAGDAVASEKYALGALRIDANATDAKLTLGYALLTQQKWGDAAQRLDEAARAAPGDADVLTALGYAYQKLGRREDAVAAFDRALALRADHPTASAFRGMTLEQMGEASKAIASYEQGAHAAAGLAASASQTKLAVVAYKERRYADARALAEAAITGDPKNAQARYVLGLAAFAMGDRKTAGEQEYELTPLDKERAEALRKLISAKE